MSRVTAVETTTTATAGISAWRRRLDAAMAEAGLWPERSPWIRTAVAALPRDRFAPALLWHWDGQAWQGIDQRTEPSRWAELLYSDPHAAAVTQLTDGLPTSSLSAQALVVDMLDSLQVDPGMRVLELGTSLSGWNAALLAHRTGPGRVITVEVDPELAAAGAARLLAAGLDAVTVLGDGAAGSPDGAPYDRVIATYGVERIPWTWIAQCRPGGRLVVPWGRLGHVALTVADDHASATGWFQGLSQFMPDRNHLGHRRGFTEIRGDAEPEGERRTDRDLAPLGTDWALRFHLRAALPEVEVITAVDGDGTSAWLHDGKSSWATLPATSDGVFVYQGGPRRLADEVEAAWGQWAELGSPSVYDYGMTVTEDQQYTWALDPLTGPRWLAT